MLNLEQTLRRNAVLAAVQRAIFCPESGAVLDIDDATLLTNVATKRCSIVTSAVLAKLRPTLAASGQTFELWHGETGDEEIINPE
jgi:hypothetical protein